MTTLLDDFETYFTTQNLTNDFIVYKDTMEDKGDNAIGIYEYGGSGTLPQITGVSRSIQVVVRAKTVRDAKARIALLYKALQTQEGILHLTSGRWTTVYLRQTPFKFKVDEKGRTYYAFNLGCTTYFE